jgi:hypothetical protein
MWVINQLIERLPWRMQKDFHEEMAARRRVMWETIREVLASITSSLKAGDPTTGWGRIHEKVKREELAKWWPTRKVQRCGAALNPWGPRAARFFVIRI